MARGTVPFPPEAPSSHISGYCTGMAKSVIFVTHLLRQKSMEIVEDDSGRVTVPRKVVSF